MYEGYIPGRILWLYATFTPGLLLAYHSLSAGERCCDEGRLRF